MFIIDDILLAPLKGVIWLGEQIHEMAEKEMPDEVQIKEKLMQLQLRFEMDEINEAEYNQQEQELLAELETIRSAKTEEEE